jgi:hypothetical protein
MPECIYKKSKKTVLCAGDMNDQITLVTRTIGAPTIGTSDPTTTFTTLLQPFAIFETLSLSASASRRFDGVNIEDRPTHKALIYYDSTIWPLDSDNVFVEFDDRRFRIVGVTDLNEMKTTIEILCTERGVDTLAATEA